MAIFCIPNKDPEGRQDANIGLRGRINTGNVIYDNFGTPSNDQLTAMGSEVHIVNSNLTIGYVKIRYLIERSKKRLQLLVCLDKAYLSNYQL